MAIPSGFSPQKPPERAGRVLLIGSRGNLGGAILKCLSDESRGPVPATLDTRDVSVAIQAIREDFSESPNHASFGPYSAISRDVFDYLSFAVAAVFFVMSWLSYKRFRDACLTC